MVCRGPGVLTPPPLALLQLTGLPEMTLREMTVFIMTWIMIMIHQEGGTQTASLLGLSFAVLFAPSERVDGFLWLGIVIFIENFKKGDLMSYFCQGRKFYCFIPFG